MKRTILNVAYPFARVSADAVGGAEQIVAILDHTVTAAGHHSLVVAAEGSGVEGTLIPVPRAAGRLTEPVREKAQQEHVRAIRAVLNEYPVDLVHMHGVDFHRYLPPGDVPVLATLHLPPQWYPAEIFAPSGRFLMNCVSESQHRSCPGCNQLLDPIPNGVDVDRLAGELPRENFALTMGRICPEKGFHFALDAARAAGARLRLAGEVYPYESHLEYFRNEIAPRLDNDRQFIGPLGFLEKRKSLQQASCVIVPSTVPETSSLVAMEALACGTPVIAFRSGALPDIVEHQRTGFLVSDAGEMAEALKHVHQLDPEVCRQAARERFSAATMSAAYLRLYESLIRDHARI